MKAAGAVQFDYDSARRGYWATLSSGRHTVILTTYPESLLGMLRAGMLTGEAKKDAEAQESHG